MRPIPSSMARKVRRWMLGLQAGEPESRGMESPAFHRAAVSGELLLLPYRPSPRDRKLQILTRYSHRNRHRRFAPYFNLNAYIHSPEFKIAD